jgi:alpha-tubulin suppressor-like RCC1 family protein
VNNSPVRFVSVNFAFALLAAACGPLEEGELSPDVGTEQVSSEILSQPNTPFFMGEQHTCAIVERGAVKCWGEGALGQLGYGDTVWRGDGPNEMGNNLPFVDLGRGRSAKALGLGDHHTCALLDNGGVKCFGWGAQGQLGYGDTANRGDGPGEMGDALPYVSLGSGRTAKQLVSGPQYNCVLLDNGAVKCWGYGGQGISGAGDALTRGDAPGEMGDALPAVSLGTGRTVKQLSAGATHACALLDNNTIKCWGGNGSGQLGLGDTNSRGDNPNELGNALPAVNLGTGRTAKAVYGGYHKTCALLDNDTLKCWGWNSSGQLGQGDTIDRGGAAGQMGDALLPVSLGTGRTVKGAMVGAFHICALLDNGTVKCWGSNTYGTLGLGDTSNRGDGPNEMGNNLPAISLGTGRTVKALGLGNTADQTCALLDNARTKCWGDNQGGRLGLGDVEWRGDTASDMGNNLPYVDLGTKRGVQTVQAGTYHACALLTSGVVKCWGGAPQGQLGNGNTVSLGDGAGEMGNALPAVNLGTGRTAKQLSVNTNGDFSCALLDNNAVKCWGNSNAGSLGTGDNNARGDNAGEMGDSLPAVNLGTGRTAKLVRAGGGFACAILDNDTLKCWGNNNDGQLGQGDRVSRGLAPTELGDALPAIPLGTGRTAKALAAGAWHVCALLDNSTVKCWGANSYGQLGQGDNQRRGDAPGELGDALPAVNLGAGRTAKAIAAGATFSCALLDTNQLKCWGDSMSGSLGYGDTVRRGDNAGEMGDALPVINVGTGRTVQAISAGGGVVCALRDDQALVCWGTGGAGNLGIDGNVNIGDAAGEMGGALVAVKLNAPLNTLVPAPSDPAVPSFAAGTTGCAVLSSGSAKCWGQNIMGQLGIGTTNNTGDAANEMATIPFLDLGTE